MIIEYGPIYILQRVVTPQCGALLRDLSLIITKQYLNDKVWCSVALYGIARGNCTYVYCPSDQHGTLHKALITDELRAHLERLSGTQALIGDFND